MKKAGTVDRGWGEVEAVLFERGDDVVAWMDQKRKAHLAGLAHDELQERVQRWMYDVNVLREEGGTMNVSPGIEECGYDVGRILGALRDVAKEEGEPWTLGGFEVGGVSFCYRFDPHPDTGWDEPLITLMLASEW